MTISSDPRLTSEERTVLDRLADAWNLYRVLSPRDTHPEADDDFRRAIHAAQWVMAGRVARRVDPDVWWEPTTS